MKRKVALKSCNGLDELNEFILTKIKREDIINICTDGAWIVIFYWQ